MLRDQTNCIRIVSLCCYWCHYTVSIRRSLGWIHPYRFYFFFCVQWRNRKKCVIFFCLFGRKVTPILTNEITRDNIWGASNAWASNRFGNVGKNETKTIFPVVKVYFPNKRKTQKTEIFKFFLRIAFAQYQGEQLHSANTPPEREKKRIPSIKIPGSLSTHTRR